MVINAHRHSNQYHKVTNKKNLNMAQVKIFFGQQSKNYFFQNLKLKLKKKRLKFVIHVCKGNFLPLCEKCPNTEFFLVRIFPYLNQIQRFTYPKNFIFGYFLALIDVM